MAQSSAGLPKWVDDDIIYDGTPEVMADYALDMAAMGVDIIGGCCGSTPAHIKAMKEALATRPIPKYEGSGAPAPAPEQKQEERRSRQRSRRRG
jgi:5-methyltetrahydrofolate--homocysteine methyltransferase